MNRLLISVPSGQTWSYSYAYDRYGNRWQQNLVGTGGSGTHFSTTFNSSNRISDGTATYDAGPRQNEYCESFNGKLREECLNRQIIYSLREAQIVIEKWRVE
jgi:hypothetical protein